MNKFYLEKKTYTSLLSTLDSIALGCQKMKYYDYKKGIESYKMARIMFVHTRMCTLTTRKSIQNNPNIQMKESHQNLFKIFLFDKACSWHDGS